MYVKPYTKSRIQGNMNKLISLSCQSFPFIRFLVCVAHITVHFLSALPTAYNLTDLASCQHPLCHRDYVCKTSFGRSVVFKLVSLQMQREYHCNTVPLSKMYMLNTEPTRSAIFNSGRSFTLTCYTHSDTTF
jgi:hypothetical protein